MKQLFQNKKILIASLVCLLLLIGTIGIASGVAQPTLEDLVYNRVYGTFVPASFYDDSAENVEDWEVVGFLKTTDIIVDYSVWYDYNEDGFIDLNDVYAQENYQFKFLMDTNTLPIIKTDDNKDYAIVKLNQFDQVDQVVASIYMANNNDKAELKHISQYYFDRDTNILYISPSLLDEVENGLEIKAQTVAIVHNIDEFTKEFFVATAINPELKQDSLANNMPNGLQKREYKKWLMDGLELPLVSVNNLAYISSEHLEVYVNKALYTNWQYDETTGVLLIPDLGPTQVNNVAIYVKDVNDVDLNSSVLQYMQNQWGSTAQAIEFKDVPENKLCQHITYVEAPKMGRTEALDFYAFVHNDDATSGNFNLNKLQVTGLTVFENAEGAVSPEDILRAIKSVYNNQTINIDTNTGVTSLANDVLSLWSPSGGAANTGNLFKVLDDMYDNYKPITTINTAYLTAVTDEVKKMTVSSYGSVSSSNQLLSSWQYWDSSAYTTSHTIGMYVVGKSNSTNQLLGGFVDKGFPYFTVTSSNIHVPSSSSYSPESSITRYDSHQTVISIVGSSKTHLYVCIAPLALENQDSLAYDRLCGFTRIRYTYTGHGTVTFIKTDVHNAWLGDAVYEIYKGTSQGGDVVNASLVNYYEYFDDTDYVNKENATTRPMGTTITTSGTAAIKISLPYLTNANEKYFFQEKTPPTGYKIDKTKWQFSLSAETPHQIVTAIDKKQNIKIHWTVYDATTRTYGTNKVPLEGVAFTIVDASGQPAKQYNDFDQEVPTDEIKYTDRDNGEIVFTVRPGTYYIRQVHTIPNYYMDMRTSAPADMDDENCNYFEVVAEADRSGVDKDIYFSHFEKRQEVKIQTQVYDEIIGNKTPPHLGGTGAGEVATEGSVWELYLTGNQAAIVGYKKTNGDPVKIQPNTALPIVSSYIDPALKVVGQCGIAYPGGGANNPGTSNNLTYISATHVKIDGIDYPLPNGTYVWKLKQASPGYVTTENRRTDLDAKWLRENETNKYKIVMDSKDESILSYVVMDRQQASLKTYSKAYTKTLEPSSFNYLTIIPTYNSYAWNNALGIYNAQNYRISTDSSHSQVQPASIERITYVGDTNGEVYAKKFQPYLSTQTNGTANLIKDTMPRAVYQLQNLTEIVSMDGGIIPANTVLGVYLSDNNGYLAIDTFGSEVINNPNVTSQDLNARFERVSVIDTLGRGVNGTALPNGDYVLTVLLAPDEHEIEDMFETTPLYYPWTVATSPQDVLTSTHVIPFYHSRNTTGPNGLENTGTYMAASPVDDTPEDPYDPRHPDSPDQSPDDSEDIPCPDNIDWIVKHRNDRAYRTIDRVNFAETQDIIPTTLALAHTDSTVTEWDTKYELFMFYEITEEEYLTAQAAYIAMGYTPNQWERNWEYRRQAFAGEVIYFRRLSLTSSGVDGAAALLTQVMAFNTANADTTAWKNYEEMDPNDTMSAAIDNTSWINMKMAEPAFQGAYHVGFGILTAREKVDPLTHTTLRKEEFSDSIAIVAIRNRQLFNLD